MQGPYPIFCRGHSGGRLLCEAFFWFPRAGVNAINLSDLPKKFNN